METITLGFSIFSLFSISYTYSQLYNSQRLPLSVVPYHYDVSVLTHMEEVDNMRFEGIVEISLRVRESTNLVVFHVTNLTVSIDQIKLSESATKKNINIIKTEINKPFEYMILQVENQLEVDSTYNLKVPFGRRFIHGETNSYFVASRKNLDTNKLSWYAVTHFERNFIRGAMPCFDEPALRATFNVTLGHHKRYQSFSNMPMLRLQPNYDLKDYVWCNYEITPPMPTYLLAYSVNEFKCTTSRTTRGKLVTFRTCQMGGPPNSTFYVSNISPKLLEYFSDLFDSPFPLEKIDQLVMRDQTSGMENWGLVLYGFSILTTHKPIEYDYYNRIAHVVGHELAHMWFGNLVTVAWWSDFWLKEGFASYFSILGVDHLHPDWNHNNLQFGLVKQIAYYLDGQYNVSLSHKVGKTSKKQLMENNEPAYFKSICVIRMMHAMLGDKAFYQGLHSYLTQYAYGSSYKDELWIQLQRANDHWGSLPNGFKVKTIMDSWTLQHGYPLLTVFRSMDGKCVTVTQKHFFVNSTRSEAWLIPLSYTTEFEQNFNDIRPLVWMKEETSINIHLNDLKDKWIIFDIQSYGYFRINYDNENWHLLAKALRQNHHIFPELNRVQLVSDSLFLYHQSLLDRDILHHLLGYLVKERSYAVWRPYIAELETLRKQLEFHHWLIKKVYNIYNGFHDGLNKLTNWNEINIVKFVMQYSCAMNIGDCVVKSFIYLKNQYSLGVPLSRHLKPAIFCATKCHGDNIEDSIKDWLKSDPDYERFCPCPIRN